MPPLPPCGSTRAIVDAFKSRIAKKEEPRLVGPISDLAAVNWREETYITETKLFATLDEDAVERWRKTFRNRKDITTREKQIVDDKAKHIAQKLRKTLAILIVCGKEPALLHFCRQNLTDDNLPYAREQLQKIEKLEGSNFFYEQFKFLPPKICGNMPESLPRNYILPIHQRKHIGGGSFSQVFEIQIDADQDGISSGKPNEEPKQYACKEVIIYDKQIRQIFDDEVLALKVLKGQTENVVRLEACFIHEDRADTCASIGYMIFQLADYTLQGYMKAKPPPRTRDELHKFLENISKLASCLSEFHHPKGTTSLKAIGIHRDLSLGNILVKGDVFMISDFGLARVKEAQTMDDCLSVWNAGDRGPYFAPECSKGAKVGRDADVWALGCILLDVVSFCFLGYRNGVEEFRRRRAVIRQTNYGDIADVSFFEGNTVKPKVLDWINSLREQPLFDGIVEGFLDIIKAMLRTGRLYTGKLWSSEEVVAQFQHIFNNTDELGSGSDSDLSETTGGASSPWGTLPPPPPGAQVTPLPPLAQPSPRAQPTQPQTKQPQTTQPQTPPATPASVTYTPETTESGFLPTVYPQDPILKPLRKLDTVFLVDNSHSDIENWLDFRMTLKQLAEIAIFWDNDGIDLHFVSGRQALLRSQNVCKILEAFDENTTREADTELYYKVDQLLANYLSRFEDAQRNARWHGVDVNYKGLNLIILTDGRCFLEDHLFYDLENTIFTWSRDLKDSKVALVQVGIQFVKIGGPEDAWPRMAQLDYGLHPDKARDIVDARKYNPHGDYQNKELLQCIMLGANHRHFDKKGEEAPLATPYRSSMVWGPNSPPNSPLNLAIS